MLQLITMVLHGTVSGLLLLGVCFLTGGKIRPARLGLASLLGGVYARLCLQKELYWLGSSLFHAVEILLMAFLFFGRGKGNIRRGLILLLLHLSVEGLSMGLFSDTAAGALISAGAVVLLCFLGMGENSRKQDLVEVELRCRGKELRLTALRDTGHFLRDPVTGQNVLIAGADTAWHLLGLTRQQLADPVNTLERGQVPGLRLIPCRTVSGGGLLLAVECERIRIDGVKTGRILAFSPEKLGISGEFQALTGGNHG